MVGRLTEPPTRLTVEDPCPRPHRRAAFDGESQDFGLLFASHAAVALAGAEHEANLRAGMDNRDVIGQAKGILSGTSSPPVRPSVYSPASPRR